MAEVTDWISAGANVAAAVGTVGALWVGAVTLRRQVNDQHRRQASAVTVGSRRIQVRGATFECFISNGSQLPIYRVRLSAKFDKIATSERVDVIEPGDRFTITRRDAESRHVYADFTDSAGQDWSRNDDGLLVPYARRGRKVILLAREYKRLRASK